MLNDSNICKLGNCDERFFKSYFAKRRHYSSRHTTWPQPKAHSGGCTEGTLALGCFEMSKLDSELLYNPGQKPRNTFLSQNNVTAPFWDSFMNWSFEVPMY